MMALGGGLRPAASSLQGKSASAEETEASDQLSASSEGHPANSRYCDS